MEPNSLAFWTTPSVLLAASTAALVATLVVRQVIRLRGLPPGPWGMPLLGYLPWIDRSNSHRTFLALSERYGDIFSFQMGGRTVIAIASYELIREAFSQALFSGRLPSRFVRRMTHGCGILFTEGQVWNHQRSFSLRYLKSVGFAKEASAKQVSVELRSMIERLDAAAEVGASVTSIDLLTPAVNSVIARLTLGRSYSEEDESYQAYIRAFDEYARLMNPLPMIFPFIDYIFHWTNTAKEIQRRFDIMFNFISGEVKSRRGRASTETGDKAEISCLADAYNAAKKEAEAAGDFEIYSDFQIVRVCMELFFGGTATTARSLEWMLLIMALHPNEQARLQLELDSCRSNQTSDEVRLEDRNALHYTMAVIDECYRRVSLSSNGTFHRATEDTNFHGYLIPKDAAIMPLAYAVHHSPRYWQHPDQFYPDHFLDSEGRYQASRHLIPFMVGRRACLGEGLARQEVFLIFANLMQRYKVTLGPDSEPKGKRLLDGKLSMIRIPEKHSLVFHRRR